MEETSSWKKDLKLEGLNSSRIDLHMNYFGSTARRYANVL